MDRMMVEGVDASGAVALVGVVRLRRRVVVCWATRIMNALGTNTHPSGVDSGRRTPMILVAARAILGGEWTIQVKNPEVAAPPNWPFKLV